MARDITVSSTKLLNLIVDTHDIETVDNLVDIHGKVTIEELAWFVEEQNLSADYLEILKEDFKRTEKLENG